VSAPEDVFFVELEAMLARYRRVAMRAQEFLLTPHRKDRAEALAAALAAVGMKVEE
jgi:hypothetical protein